MGPVSAGGEHMAASEPGTAERSVEMGLADDLLGAEAVRYVLPPPPPSSPPRRPAGPRRWRTAALAVVVLVFVASAGVLMHARGQRVSAPRRAASRSTTGSSRLGSLRGPGPSSQSSAAIGAQSGKSTAATRATMRTVDRYYAAINAKDWPRVWALGGKNLDPSYPQMVNGYAHTAHDLSFLTALTAGHESLYLLAYETDGLAQLYHGSLTVHDGTIVAGAQRLDYTDTNRSFDALAGYWSAHDAAVQITPGGLGIISYRTFDNCTEISSGCDHRVGDEIIPGGITIFRLTGGEGVEATGRILWSTTSHRRAITLTAHADNDTIALSLFHGSLFCGKHAPVWACGA